MLSIPACSAGGADDADDSSVGMFANPGGGAAPGTSTTPATGNPPSTNPNGSQPGPATGSGGSGNEVPGSNVNNVAPPMPNNQTPGTSMGGAGNSGAAGAPNTMGSAGAGAAGSPGAAGSGGQPGGNGGFTSVDVDGGASARFACPTGVTFGNPLTGMGQVQQVNAPQGGFFAFIEGALWVGSVGRVFFSDNASQPERIWQVTPPSTTASVFMENSGSNGLAVDTSDQLLLADQRNRRITRVSTATAQVTGEIIPMGNYTPNDLVMRSDGNVYFTDPNSSGRGFYRVSPAGALSGPFSSSNSPNTPNNPNGVVLSPDENTLYVGDVNARFVAKLDLNVDGSIDTASGERFVSTMGDTVDGMAVDCAGNLYVGTRTGVEVYTPAGMMLGTVPTGESSNATFGGADRRTLFVTSRSVLKFVTLGVPGLPD